MLQKVYHGIEGSKCIPLQNALSAGLFTILNLEEYSRSVNGLQLFYSQRPRSDQKFLRLHEVSIEAPLSKTCLLCT